jgi:hypothetical protein
LPWRNRDRLPWRNRGRLPTTMNCRMMALIEPNSVVLPAGICGIRVREMRFRPPPLVHEAYLHLMDAKSANWQDRAHFFAASAQLMRRILIDLARAHHSEKRGGGVGHIDHSTAVDLDEIPASDRSAELLALDEAPDASRADGWPQRPCNHLFPTEKLRP